MVSATERVSLVGAGPGDPGLLTLKAAERLRQADVVVYDRLVSPEVLDLVPPGTTRIFVGKSAGRHHVSQDDINDLLVRLAAAGHRVVRLKGGDPFIFGRGSEEAQHLARHGVPFEVIPGITAASGVCSALGVPLTHRGLATSVRFVTGHCRADAELDLDWRGLADANTTLVLYMANANLARIALRLIDAGLAPGTPALAVASCTSPHQRQCRGTLESLPAHVEELGLAAPMLVVVGEVVTLAETLNWQGLAFEGEDTREERAVRG